MKGWRNEGNDKVCKKEPINWNEYNYEINVFFVKDIRLLWTQDWLVKKFSIEGSFPEVWENLYPYIKLKVE